MGVYFSIYSLYPMEDADNQQILAESDAIARDFSWWMETFEVFDDGFFLEGDSKWIGPLRYPDDDSIDDDEFMKSRDMLLIIEFSRRWANCYGATWAIELAGKRLGYVTPDGIDSDLADTLDDTLALGDVARIDERAREIARTYDQDFTPLAPLREQYGLFTSTPEVVEVDVEGNPRDEL